MARFKSIGVQLLLGIGLLLACRPGVQADSHHFTRNPVHADQQRDEVERPAPNQQIAQDLSSLVMRSNTDSDLRNVFALLGLSMEFLAVLLGIGLLCSAFWLWMFIDCLVNETGPNNEKLVWGLVIWFTSFIGAVIYYFVRRKERLRR